MERDEIRGFREDEVQGPFLKEKKSRCSSSVESTKESKFFKGIRSFWAHFRG